MDRDKFAKESSSMDKLARELLLKKNGDYANEDALWNFKARAQVNALLEIDTGTPIGIALSDTLLKILRICNLLYLIKTEPANESIKDSFIDAHNYITIAYLCWLEHQEKSQGIDLEKYKLVKGEAFHRHVSILRGEDEKR